MKKIIFLFITFYCSIIILNNKEAKAQVSVTDSLALVALYNSTDGANWTSSANWLTANVSTWYGITVTDTSITEIYLGHNNLVGSIPPEIGNLNNLQRLYLGYNHLSGSIPAEIGNLDSLQYLFLYSNQLSGSIPAEIGNLNNLQELYLGYNQLSGLMPAEINNLSSLQYLDLSFNNLSGSIPAGISNLINLQYLFLYGNNLSGSIPAEIGNMNNLQKLYLYNNQFTGEIPAEIGDITNLQDLNLGNNHLSGSIPAEICNLNSLQKLYLYSNQFTDFTDISSIATLTELKIENNKLDFSDAKELRIADTLSLLTVYTYAPQDPFGVADIFNLCKGDTIILSIASQDSALSYQWFKGIDTITGATDTLLIVPNITLADQGVYTCKSYGTALLFPPMNFGPGISEFVSEAITVNVSAIIVDLGADTIFTSQPDTVILDAATATGGTLPYTYQWQDSSTNSTFNVPAVGCYSVTVTDVNTCSAADTICIALSSYIDNLNDKNFNISIYPNPNKGTFHLNFYVEKPENIIIQIINDLGQNVYKQEHKKFKGNYNKEIDISSLKNGIYMLNIRVGENTYTRNIFVM